MSNSLTGLKEKILKEVTIYPKKGIKVVIPKEESGWKEDQVFSSDYLPEKLKGVKFGTGKVIKNGRLVLCDKYLLKDTVFGRIHLRGELGLRNAEKIFNTICQKIFEGSTVENEEECLVFLEGELKLRDAEKIFNNIQQLLVKETIEI